MSRQRVSCPAITSWACGFRKVDRVAPSASTSPIQPIAATMVTSNGTGPANYPIPLMNIVATYMRLVCNDLDEDDPCR